MSRSMKQGMIAFSGVASVHVRFKCPECKHEVTVDLSKDILIKIGLEEL